jgi:16S rRNA (cytosine967-C5)-methyltransferase
MSRGRSARDVARRVLGRVEAGAYANLALAGELGRAPLDDSDRALATELVYGVLKRRSRIDRALAAASSRGIGGVDRASRDALRVAGYQILFLRVPAHAAVDDAVGAIKRLRGERLAGFANALLRRLAREGEPPLPAERGADLAERLSVAESTPRWLVEEALRAVGEAEAPALLAAWNAPAPTWLRANLLRTEPAPLVEALQRWLAEHGRPGATVRTAPLAPEALAVVRGGDLFSTELYARGLFTAQDLGAQLIARLVAPQPGERLLDACAGTGGKCTHLAALADNRATIDAADLSPRKLELCADHAHRLGVAGLRTLHADLTDERAPLAPSYDRVLLDAPCSGFGVLRRHPELKWRRTVDDVAALAALQARLLAALARRVRPGGLLVYAVCTFTDAEAPAQVARFLAAHPDFAREPAPAAFAPVATAEGSIRTWPHRDDADAFYAIRLRRA